MNKISFGSLRNEVSPVVLYVVSRNFSVFQLLFSAFIVHHSVFGELESTQEALNIIQNNRQI